MRRRRRLGGKDCRHPRNPGGGTIDLIQLQRETGPTSMAYLDGNLWVSIE